MPREVYVSMYGPTVGDVVQLGDTCLYIRVEKDFTIYGNECKFGGGKVSFVGWQRVRVGRSGGSLTRPRVLL